MVDLTGAVSNAAALQLAFNNRPHAIQPNRCRQRRVPGQLSGPQRCSQHDICSRRNSCCTGMRRRFSHRCSLRCCPGNGDGHSQGLCQCIGSGHSPRYVALITVNMLLNSFPPSDRSHDTFQSRLKRLYTLPSGAGQACANAAASARAVATAIASAVARAFAAATNQCSTAVAAAQASAFETKIAAATASASATACSTGL